MRIDVDDQVIRLDRAGFDELVGEAERPEDSAALRVPGVPQAISAVRNPVVQLNVDVAGHAAVQTHRVWVDHDMAAFLLAVHDGEHQLMAVPPALVAAGLARVLRVGPQPVGPRAARAVDAELLADLFHPDELRRGSAFTILDLDFAWNLALVWPGGERWLAVGQGRQGAWRVTGEGEHLELVPTNGTEIWRSLTGLLSGLPD